MPLVLATRSSARWVEEIPLGGDAKPVTHRPARFSFRMNAHSLLAKTPYDRFDSDRSQPALTPGAPDAKTS
jgi:hypothetical protein